MVTTLKTVQVLKQPFHTLQLLWRRRFFLLTLLLLLLKLICVNLNRIYPPPPVSKATDITYDPLSLFDPSSSTFNVLDRSNVSFLIQPEQAKACPSNSSLLLLALSALANIGRREAMRREFEKHPEVGIVFLLAQTADKKEQARVEEEAAGNGDILQVFAKFLISRFFPHYH